MATKKYQIFISSTFSDLQDERQLAIKAILDLDHIPAGMEAFPAVDMEQFEYIKKVVDECDYYILIIGARYGSVDNDGVSYTEREFDYAVSTEKTVIALLHDDIENLPKKKFDDDAMLLVKLNAFRDKVKSGRMVRMWRNRDQLIAGLMQAIPRAIQMYPSPGWIRGDTAANDEIMENYVQLHAMYDDLLKRHQLLLESNSARITGLATLDDLFTIRYRYSTQANSLRFDSLVISWGKILKLVGPDFFSPSGAAIFAHNIIRYIQTLDRNKFYLSINDEDLDTIKIHLHALGLLTIYSSPSVSGGVSEFIVLTDKGRAELINVTAMKAVHSTPADRS